MSKNSQDSLLREWEKLLKAARDSASELPGSASYRAVLERALERAVSSRKQREAFRRSAQKATSQMEKDFRACHDAASALRSFVKSVLGRYSEKLLRYGVRPLRRRRGAARKIPVGCEVSS